MSRLGSAVVMATLALTAPAHAAVTDVDVNRDRTSGFYFFTGECDSDECEGVRVRVGRRDLADLFISPFASDGAFTAQYRVRCSGPRGVNWDVAELGDVVQSGFFRMPRCGKYRPSNEATIGQARFDARERTIRAVNDEGYGYGAACKRTSKAVYRCRVEYFVGDSLCTRRYRLKYEHRSGDERYRTRTKFLGSSCRYN